MEHSWRAHRDALSDAFDDVAAPHHRHAGSWDGQGAADLGITPGLDVAGHVCGDDAEALLQKGGKEGQQSGSVGSASHPWMKATCNAWGHGIICVGAGRCVCRSYRIDGIAERAGLDTGLARGHGGGAEGLRSGGGKEWCGIVRLNCLLLCQSVHPQYKWQLQQLSQFAAPPHGSPGALCRTGTRCAGR